jgi:membrane protein
VSAVVLVVSALAFARALQRLYERAWELEARGMRDAGYGLLWLAACSLYVTAHAALADRIHGSLGLVASIAGGFLLWLATPYIILARRLPWARLVPQAMLAAVGMTALQAASALYAPRAVASASRQFGTIGVAFSIVSWLFAAALVLTVSVAVGASITGGPRGARAPAPLRLISPREAASSSPRTPRR